MLSYKQTYKGDNKMIANALQGAIKNIELDKNVGVKRKNKKIFCYVDFLL